MQRENAHGILGLAAMLIAGICVMCGCAGAQASDASDSPRQVAGIAIGIQGLPGRGDAARWAAAEGLGLSYAGELFGWVEDEPGVYAWSREPEKDKLKRYFAELKKWGYKIQMADGTVHMDQKHLPKVMAGKRFNDPELLNAWEAYLTAFLAQYGDYIDFFAIGNEVLSYFHNKPDEWNDYVAFVKRGSEVIHRLRPEIKVGVIFAEEDPGKRWQDVAPFCDYFGYNYCTPCSTFRKSPTKHALDPERPEHFAKIFEQALRTAGDKPILISEMGCATHPEIDSSPELQAQFIRMLFQWIRGKEGRILAMSWLGVKDWPYEGTRQALQGYLDSRLLEHGGFMRYLTSLGLQ